MQVEELKGGWIKRGSVIAYPYEWQRPAKTEEWVYETLIEKQVNSMFVEFIAFPWATLIDLLNKNKIRRAENLISVLNYLPPKKTLVRITACQHINLDVAYEYLRKIRITDIYWSHKSRKVKELNHIRLHSLALYPVAYFDGCKLDRKKFKDRKYLYSFVGAYSLPGYTSESRKQIFKLPNRQDALVIPRDAWHFEGQVYKMDINGEDLSGKEIRENLNNQIVYREVMAETIYSLCPDGAGPNTIRLWESLMFGCIPIVISSDYEFPSECIESRCIRLKDMTEFEPDLLEKPSMETGELDNFDLLFNLLKIFITKEFVVFLRENK